MSRPSLEIPLTPNIPDFLFMIVSISSGVYPYLFSKNGTIAGSISPQRVPIMIPPRGVNPIDVLYDLPFLTAVILAPFPK